MLNRISKRSNRSNNHSHLVYQDSFKRKTCHPPRKVYQIPASNFYQPMDYRIPHQSYFANNLISNKINLLASHLYTKSYLCAIKTAESDVAAKT